MKLDHIVFAASRLEAGIDAIASLTGEHAAVGGSHPGSGTCNALLSLGSDQYLEIMAPDPEQEPAGTMAEALLKLDQPRIFTWAAATADFDALREACSSIGYTCREQNMSRTRPDGVTLSWRLMFIASHPFGFALPFFIDWLESPHPAADSPGDTTLAGFSVSCPRAADYAGFCDAIGLQVEVEAGEPGFSATLQSAKGTFMLA